MRSDDWIPSVREDMLQGQFMLDLLSGRFNESGAKREAKRLRVAAEGRLFVVVLFTSEQDSLASLLIDPSGMIREALNRVGTSWAIALPGRRIAAIVSCDAAEEAGLDRVLCAAERLRDLLSRATGRSITAALSEPVPMLSHLSDAYDSAERSLALREFLGGGQTLWHRKDASRVQVDGCHYPQMMHIDEAVRTGGGRGLRDVVEQTVRELLEEGDSPARCRNIFEEIVRTLDGADVKYCGVRAEEIVRDDSYFDALRKIRNRASLNAAVRRVLDDRADRGDIRGSRRLLVEQAMAYIQQNHARRVSLRELAEHLHISPSYFCKLFRAETGENFTAYVARCRIERAKVLLNDPRLKIYEIANQVGYSEVQYFNRVFRSVTGVSPNTYRENRK